MLRLLALTVVTVAFAVPLDQNHTFMGQMDDNEVSAPNEARTSPKQVAFDAWLLREFNQTYAELFSERNSYSYEFAQHNAHFSGPGIDGSTISVEGPVNACCGSAGSCRDNPKDQCVKDCGPLPRGTYQLSADTVYHNMRHCYVLAHVSGDECGRSGFLIHGGDGVSCTSGNPSIGCIVIMDEHTRYLIKGGGMLTVVE
mmetsp:Transcript_65821/g.143677  ORF Transcript_65821/g.143677 Transcript_65821/m.143677 type:complete len:199 (-) Transcript_65821:319-915(-)